MLQKQEKSRIVEDLASLCKGHKVIGVLNIHKLPAKQLQTIKSSLKESAVIRVSRKSLLERALKQAGMESLLSKIKDEPALIFSDENPFRLFKIIRASRTPASAKAGDLAQNDIIIKKGPTSQPPGPAISTFQKAGLKTTVEQGKIAIAKDTVVVKEGGVITKDHVNVFSLMKIEPMEIGLEVTGVLEDGVIYDKAVLDISTEDYVREMESAIARMFNLSLNTGYIVPDTALVAVSKAFSEAKQLAIAANVMDKNFIDDILRKAVMEAKSIESLLP